MLGVPRVTVAQPVLGKAMCNPDDLKAMMMRRFDASFVTTRKIALYFDCGMNGTL